MQCDMCGTKKATVVGLIEGVELKVCDDCIKFGKRIKTISTQKVTVQYVQKPQRPQIKEPIIMIVPQFGKLIKDAREKRGLKQAEVALKISEKESLLHNIENGRHEPSVEVAKKLEKFFHIKLIEELEDKEDTEQNSKNQSGLTIADFIKKRK